MRLLTDPTQAIGNWKEAWEKAKERAGVVCRFHDLRHTGCTRMLEAGIPFAVVAEVMGWSPSTAIRMAAIYGHIGQRARTDAMAALCKEVGPQFGPQLVVGKESSVN